MARLLVVHDTRVDVQVEITPTDEGDWSGKCTCGWTVAEDFGAEAAVALRDVVEAAQIHVDQTHGSL